MNARQELESQIGSMSESEWECFVSFLLFGTNRIQAGEPVEIIFADWKKWKGIPE